jgi:tetratricopeptide (TPR) repeat protein
VVAAGIVSAAIDWTWQLPAVFGCVVVAAALLTGPASLPGPSAEPATTESRPRRRRSPWRVIAVPACLLLAVASGLQLLSSLELDRSQSEIRGGDLAAAADDARAASAIEPWFGAAYLQLALVQEQGGDLTGAIDSIRHAADHDSEDWSVWLIRARLEAERGNARAANAALARSRELNPRSPVFTFLPSRP